MFGPESVWGCLAAHARNRRHPAASMMKAMADIEAASVAAFQHPDWRLAPHLTAPLQLDPEAVPEVAVLDSGRAASASEWFPKDAGTVQLLTLQQVLKLQNFYLEMWGEEHRYSLLGGEYVALVKAQEAHLRRGTKHLREGDQLVITDASWVTAHFVQWLRARSWATAEDLDMANCIADSFAIVRRYAGVQCGDFQLSESDCYLARRSMLTPAEQQSLWFGRGELLFHHTGPDGQTRLISQVGGWGA